MNCRKPTLYCTCQFQTLAQPSNTAAHLTGNVELTEKFQLNIITLALDTRYLLGSRPGRFIPGETGQYILTTKLCEPQSQSGSFGEDRKHSNLPDFETWDLPAENPVRKQTAAVFFKKFQVEKVSNLLTYGCCHHSSSFVYSSLLLFGVMYFISKCEDFSIEPIRD
jgi:hypothetical protein